MTYCWFLHAQAATDRVQEPIQGVLNVLDYSAHHHGSPLKELALPTLFMYKNNILAM